MKLFFETFPAVVVPTPDGSAYISDLSPDVKMQDADFGLFEMLLLEVEQNNCGECGKTVGSCIDESRPFIDYEWISSAIINGEIYCEKCAFEKDSKIPYAKEIY